MIDHFNYDAVCSPVSTDDGDNCDIGGLEAYSVHPSYKMTMIDHLTYNADCSATDKGDGTAAVALSPKSYRNSDIGGLLPALQPGCLSRI